MKTLLICLILAGIPAAGNAQSKQVKLLLQQISALKTYTDYARQGYTIYKKGLTAIGDLKEGELGLHNTYLNSLKLVNPAVKNNLRVSQSLALGERIMASYGKTYGQLAHDQLLYADEKEYVKRVYQRLLEDCEQLLDELERLTSDNQLEMKDDQRIRRIEALYLQMRANSIFCEGFGNQIRVLSLSRAKEQNDVRTSRAVRGINPN